MKIKPVLGFNKYIPKDGLLPIYIKVNIGQKRKLIPLDVKITKNFWDPKACRVKLDHPNAQDINFKIIDLLNSIEKNYIKDETIGAGDMDDFYWWFDQRLEYTQKSLSRYHYKKLYVVKSKLQAFAPRLPFKSLDNLFLMQYELHLASLGNQKNTIADNLYRIRTIVNMIRKKFRDWPGPFEGYEFKTTKVRKKRLTIEQILQLWALPLDHHPQKQLAVHLYVFSFFNAGIRWGDLTRLKVKDILEHRLRYTMHKTDIDKNLKQMPIAVEIATLRSKGKKADDYLFDIGVSWRKSEDKGAIDMEEQSINDRGTLYNKYLKLVCKSINIPEVTYHTARHSFADYTKKKKFGGKFDFHTLKDLLGHKHGKTTEIYMNSIDEEDSDVAMDQLFGDLSAPPNKKGKQNNKKK